MLFISFFFEITQNYTVILFKVIGRKQTSKISQFFTRKHKINESNVKVPHIIELFACTQKMLAIMFLFPINSLISSGTYSTPKLSK